MRQGLCIPRARRWKHADPPGTPSSRWNTKLASLGKEPSLSHGLLSRNCYFTELDRNHSVYSKSYSHPLYLCNLSSGKSLSSQFSLHALLFFWGGGVGAEGYT